MNKHLDDERFAYMEKNGFTKEMVILYEEIAQDKENPNHNVELLAKRESLWRILDSMQDWKRLKKIGDTLCLILLSVWLLLLVITKLSIIPNLESMLGFDPYLLVVGISMFGLPVAIGTTLAGVRLVYLKKAGLKLINEIDIIK